jgi:glycosyltransferase involved in cell wall biosynthesis
MTHVVVDGFHFLLKNATGIGSYARTLASSLRHLGCQVGILYGQRVQATHGDPPLRSATQIFGNEPTRAKWDNLISDFQLLLADTFGGRFSPLAIDVPTKGLELSAHEPALPACDQILNADGLFDRARAHFYMRRRLLDVRLPDHCSLAHWTGPLPVKARGVPNVYTLHDLIPLQFPYLVIDKGGRAAQLHHEIARQADHIVTVSQSSKQHIMDLLDVDEDRVSVTYQPVPHLPTLPKADAERLVEAVYGVTPGEYALFLGAIEPKKNLKRLIEAFLLADVGIPLLAAGPLGWLYDGELELFETISRQSRRSMISGEISGTRLNADARRELAPVRQLGYLPRRHLVALLQCARCFLFPSIYEGFGLPVVEAMQLGVPVLTSDVGPLREVVGDAAVLVDPLDVPAMAQEIRRLANDKDLQAHLRQRGPVQAATFNTASYGARLAAAYRKVGIEIQGAPEATRSA